LVTLPKIAGLEYWVQLLFNFTPVSVRQVKTGPYYQFNHSKVEAIPLSALARTQQANLPAHLHTNPFKCWTSSREAV